MRISSFGEARSSGARSPGGTIAKLDSVRAGLYHCSSLPSDASGTGIVGMKRRLDLHGDVVANEASTESEWVARHLEALGHEVIVADPNVAPMSATRSRRTTTAYRLLRGPIQYIGPLLRSQHDWQISPAWVPEVGPGRSVSFSA